MLVEVAPAVVRVPGGSPVPGVGVARPEREPQIAAQALLPGGEDAAHLHLRRVSGSVVHGPVMPGVDVAAHEDEIAGSPRRAEMRDEERKRAPPRIDLGAKADADGPVPQRLTEPRAAFGIHGDDRGTGE